MFRTNSCEFPVTISQSSLQQHDIGNTLAATHLDDFTFPILLSVWQLLLGTHIERALSSSRRIRRA